MTLAALLLGRQFWAESGVPRHVTYTELLASVDAGKVVDARMQSDHVFATVRTEQSTERVVAERIPNMDERPLLEALEKHALVASSVKHSDPVHRVTIIPVPRDVRGAARPPLRAAGRPLGRGDRVRRPLTGAEDALERASEIAHQMVCRFGMSDVLGSATWHQSASYGLPSLLVQDGDGRRISEETARTIDLESISRRFSGTAPARATLPASA